MLATRNFGDWHAVVVEVPRSSVVHVTRRAAAFEHAATCPRPPSALKTKHARRAMWQRRGLMSLQTQCPASDEHVSAAEARRNMSCRHLKHACQDQDPPQLSHQEVKQLLGFITSLPSCREGLRPQGNSGYAWNQSRYAQYCM